MGEKNTANTLCSRSQLQYLSSFHDLLGFCIEVEISPQGFEQHLWPNAYPLAVDMGKLLNATKHTINSLLQFCAGGEMELNLQ